MYYSMFPYKNDEIKNNLYFYYPCFFYLNQRILRPIYNSKIKSDYEECTIDMLISTKGYNELEVAEEQFNILIDKLNKKPNCNELYPTYLYLVRYEDNTDFLFVENYKVWRIEKISNLKFKVWRGY